MIGKIYINGLIGDVQGQKGVTLIDVISQVRKQPDATSFEVYINSEGGRVDVGFDIYNYLVSLGVPIHSIGGLNEKGNPYNGVGVVASIATVFFMAGTKRTVKPNTKFMIHLPMGNSDYVTADEMEMLAKEVKKTENKVIDFYSEVLNLNKEAINPLLKNETWLTESQLIDLGFVTTNTEMKISARAKTNIKKKKMSKTSKLQAIINFLKGENEIVNKVVYTADEKEINFPDLGEEDVIGIGAKATVDGQPAEGEVVSADGTTYIFEGGILKEIREKESDVEDEISEEEMLDALTQTLEVAVELEERVNAMETEVLAVAKERDDFKEKFEKATETIAKLKGVSETPETPAVNKEEKKLTVSDAVAQWKNKKNKKG